jgi:hypothetical protein
LATSPTWEDVVTGAGVPFVGVGRRLGFEEMRRHPEMLHWLPEDAVRRLYRDLAGLVRRGGVVAHSEQMPLTDMSRPHSPEIERQCRAGPDDRRARWDAWWEQASSEPALQQAMTERRSVFETTYPTEEFSPPADRQITALRDAGFLEVGLVWRSGPAAVIAAVR